MLYPWREKRDHPRYSFKEAATVPFSTILSSSKSRKLLHVQVQDLSEGGVGLRGEHGVEKNQVVRCALNLPGLPVSIPTLMQVRWTRKLPRGYLMGLQFLI